MNEMTNLDLTNVTEPKNCIIQLERNDRILSQMHKKLSSYIYEPNTTSLFEQSEDLKHKMSTLKKANIEILNSFKHKKQIVKNEIEYVKNQFKAINDLQAGIDSYFTSVKSY